MIDANESSLIPMPSQLFTLANTFEAVANGKIYIGKIDTDPTIPENQIQVYLENDDGSTVAVAQPIIISARGYPVYNGKAAKFVTVEGYSMAVYDTYNVQQFYFQNILRYSSDQFRILLEGPTGIDIVCADSGITRNYINMHGITLHGMSTIGDQTVALKARFALAESSGLPIHLAGGGIYNISDEIVSNVSIYGDGKTRIVQTVANKSTIVLNKDGLRAKDLIVTPSFSNNSIKQAGIEIRRVNNCHVDSCRIIYAGRTTTEGSGIVINEGSYNTISNNKISGANLSDGVNHPAGGNDIAVYGNASNNKVFDNLSIGRNMRGIYQLTNLLGQQCNYNQYIRNTSFGNIGYGHICYELNHDSNTAMRATLFKDGIVANIVGSARIPDGAYAGLKVFGAGVYNQEGQDTRIEGYYIYNVCQDPEIQDILPMAGISSTRGDLHVANNTVRLSGKSGIKISAGSGTEDNRNPIIDNCYINSCTGDAIYIVGTNRVRISGIEVLNCARIARVTGNASYASSNALLTDITASGCIGILVEGVFSAEISNVSGISCNGVVHVKNANYLLISSCISSLGGASASFNIENTVTDGNVKNCIAVDGVTGFALNGRINYDGLISERNSNNNFTGTYAGVISLGTVSDLNVKNITFGALSAGADITSISGGVTNQRILLRCTKERKIVGSATIILKKDFPGTLSVNDTIEFWCLNGENSTWLQL